MRETDKIMKKLGNRKVVVVEYRLGGGGKASKKFLF